MQLNLFDKYNWLLGHIIEVSIYVHVGIRTFTYILLFYYCLFVHTFNYEASNFKVLNFFSC